MDQIKQKTIKENFHRLIYFILTTIFFLVISQQAFSQDIEIGARAVPQIIIFNPESTNYQKIFDGEKDSVVFYSGVVTIAPNKAGHLHSTEIYEEMIVVLEGEGQVKITNNRNLDLKFGNVAYIPPNTEHQVFNTGIVNLKYIYIATKSK
ncbi:MAG: cupin domain-containing protein [Ignavibacteria bacterium]